LQAKINPGVTHELWVNAVHGENVASASLIVRYDDLAHFAESTMREDASQAWNEFIAEFPADKFPITFTGLSQTIYGDAPNIKGGEAMSIFVFTTVGDTAGLAELASQAAEILSRVNPEARMEVVRSTVGGTGTGSAAVLTRYPSLVSWAEGITKQQMSEEWRTFFAAFPAEKYRLVYQGLSQAIGTE